MPHERYTLITGGAGFVGSNLADALLEDGERVVIVDDLSREGVGGNLEWLRARHGDRLRVEVADVAEGIDDIALGASRVYHLAAQTAVTTSLEDPARDFDTNLVGTFRLLETLRRAPQPPPLLFTSTNKVYGSLDALPVVRTAEGYRFTAGVTGISESHPLDLHSPYGCSKGGAELYVRDYGRVFDLPTVVFRMSCVYGSRQLGTEDQGWVAHFASSLAQGNPVTIFGDGYQVRDLLWVGDLVRAMRIAMGAAQTFRGEVFNIGGGSGNAVSVRTVVQTLSDMLGRPPEITFAPWRAADQRVYVSDLAHAERRLGWQPEMGWRAGLEQLLEWFREGNPSPSSRDRGATDRQELEAEVLPLGPEVAR
jgi:CDP-paratose 2-epimerase